VTVTLVSDIGLLVTNTEAGELRNAWLVHEDGVIRDLGTGGLPAADRRLDVGGRCVIPGFVDSHTHLVFAGDRAAEFTARMAGEPYAAGGINVTTAATRAATEEELLRLARMRLAEAHAQGITTVEIKSGYGLTVEDEAQLLRVARWLSPETTFLGAHVVPDEYAGRSDDYVDLVTGPMLDAALAEHPRWIDVFCETGAFDADQTATILVAGRARGLGARVHANQLGPGPGVQVAVAADAASADHCTYLTDDDIEALAGSDTVATFLPAADFSTRQPYPDARTAIDAGVTVALATNTNPGSSYTSSMAFCIALAVRDMGMTATEALTAATLGGARALRRDDIGWLGKGSRADLTVLEAPHYSHFVYRPGMPSVHHTIVGGQTVA
jgi:imidazolonepropionase